MNPDIKTMHPLLSPIPILFMHGAMALLLASCASTGQSIGDCNGVEVPTSRHLLQQVTDHSAIIKWRGEADIVCAGKDIDRLHLRVTASNEDTHKLVRLTGLAADTTYYYSIGGAGSGDASKKFRTAPITGQLPADGNTHIWLLGDSGTATEQFNGRYSHPGEALAVKNGFLKYNREQAGNEPLDLLLLIGDNAYPDGTDAEWQGAFFDIYPDLIGRTAVWPTIGNHEMGVMNFDLCPIISVPGCDEGPVIRTAGGMSVATDPASYDSDGDGPDDEGMPYLNIFTLPSQGEAGGVASGTEQYYAFDYGNVHVVSLDSQLSNRDPAQRLAMRDWLVDDLGQNRLDWTVVIFHHPTYTKGQNHDSDREQAEIDMRETFAPVFEDHGVDVVYSGHSHSYERSWYLHGHYGLSDSFDADEHAELNARGKPSLGQGQAAYNQVSNNGNDDKAVYTVAGSSGKADRENPCTEDRIVGCSLPSWLGHPAHRTFSDSIPGAHSHGLARRGSVVLDATRTTLTSRFVDENGEVLDHFIITRK